MATKRKTSSVGLLLNSAAKRRTITNHIEAESPDLGASDAEISSQNTPSLAVTHRRASNQGTNNSQNNNNKTKLPRTTSTTTSAKRSQPKQQQKKAFEGRLKNLKPTVIGPGKPSSRGRTEYLSFQKGGEIFSVRDNVLIRSEAPKPYVATIVEIYTEQDAPADLITVKVLYFFRLEDLALSKKEEQQMDQSEICSAWYPNEVSAETVEEKCEVVFVSDKMDIASDKERRSACPPASTIGSSSSSKHRRSSAGRGCRDDEDDQERHEVFYVRYFNPQSPGKGGGPKLVPHNAEKFEEMIRAKGKKTAKQAKKKANELNEENDASDASLSSSLYEGGSSSSGSDQEADEHDDIEESSSDSGGELEGLDEESEGKKKRPSRSSSKSKNKKNRSGGKSKPTSNRLSSSSRRTKSHVAAPVQRSSRNRVRAASKVSISALAHHRELDESTIEQAKQFLHVSAVPDTLPCREVEFLTIMDFIKSRIESSSGGCMFVSGVPGTGKTATIRSVARSLEQLIDEGEINQFKFVEINGMALLTPQHAYTTLLSAITGENYSAPVASKLLEAMFTEQRPSQRCTVALIDELDQLWTRDQRVIYNLFDWPRNKHSRLIVVAVANTMDLPERVLSNRSQSRLGLIRLNFLAYKKDQLISILRARLASLMDAFEEKSLELCAAKVAKYTGDARRALELCRRAAELADIKAKTSGTPPRVRIEDVNAAWEEMNGSPMVHAIQAAPLHERLFLLALCSKLHKSGLSECAVGEVVSLHLDLCRLRNIPPPSTSSIFGICSRLAASRLVVVEHSHHVVFQRVRLNCPLDDALLGLSDDPLVQKMTQSS